MSDKETRRQLEINFAKNIDATIDQLLWSNFSENDIVIFTDTVKKFLKFEDLKIYILDAIHDKIMEASKIIKPHDVVRFASYRKLVGIVLDINNEELTDSLETFLSRNQPHHFLAFVEEKIKKGMSIETATDSFIELIKVNDHPIEIIDKFLSIIGKDRPFMIRKFLGSKSYNRISIHRFISDIISKEPHNVGEDVVVPIIGYYKGALDQYFYLIQDIMAQTHTFHHSLLNDSSMGNCMLQCWEHIIANCRNYLGLIKNFYFYLEEYYPDLSDQFEIDFLQGADGFTMVSFAMEVPSSKKRKILRRLVEIKNEAALVFFIEKFPEYSSLLPML